MARRRRRRTDPPVTADGVPVEFVDDAHPLWHDREAYLDYMDENGWPLPPLDRVSLPPPPSDGGPDYSLPTEEWPPRRRVAAVAGWAVDQGIVSAHGHGFPDWHALRRMGLVPGGVRDGS